MVRDDAYHVIRVLADGPTGRTELVTLDGEGPLVRKHMPAEIANASAWAVAMETDEPLLPRIESLYRMPDEFVVVYEYVPGSSLLSMVEEQGRLTVGRAVQITSDVCRAVTALHERGVVHRDITPDNVIVAKDGAHLVDLGIARQRIEGKSRDTNTLGTWGFAAPEQYGFAQTDARSDIYAIGKLLGYALTGARPDSDEYETRLANASVVPTELAEVVRRATEFEPSVRYQSAAELSNAAQAALGKAGSHRRVEERPAANKPKDERQDDLLDDSFWTREYSTRASNEGSTASGPEPEPEQMPDGEPDAADGPLFIFARAPFVRRVLAVFFWVCCFLMDLVAVGTMISETKEKSPRWGMPQNVMAIVIAVGMLVMMREAWRMISEAGPYADSDRPVRSFLINECIIFLIICIGVIMTAVVYAFISVIS